MSQPFRRQSLAAPKGVWKTESSLRRRHLGVGIIIGPRGVWTAEVSNVSNWRVGLSWSPGGELLCLPLAALNLEVKFLNHDGPPGKLDLDV